MGFFTWQNVVSATVIIAGIVTFLANIQRIVEWIAKTFFIKLAQPKLAISITNFLRGQSRIDDIHYLSGDFKTGQVMTPAILKEVSYDYRLHWDYDISITNQADINAYNVRIIHPEKSSGITLGVNPEIDYTIPFKPAMPFVTEFRYWMIDRLKVDEATDRVRRGAVDIMRLEYTNQYGKKFATNYYINESNVEKKNVYLKIK